MSWRHPAIFEDIKKDQDIQKLIRPIKNGGSCITIYNVFFDSKVLRLWSNNILERLTDSTSKGKEMFSVLLLLFD